MSLPGQSRLPQRWIVPLPLLAGVALSFLSCCLAGRMLARVNCLGHFTRFHVALGYQTLYYPTVSQVRSLARETLDPNKIAVVLGGNSILQGVGQGASGNWALRLQELLGDDFQVLNLALPNAYTFEFGSVAAEALLPDHPRLILLTNNIWPVARASIGDPDGRPFVRYFYWQAQARGLLAASPERDEALRRLEEGRDESFRELRRQCALDARLAYHDLWNAATCRFVSTVWCAPLAASWTRPRGAYPDPDLVLPPVNERRAAFAAKDLATLRGILALTRQFLPPSGHDASWREPHSPLPGTVGNCLSPCLRGRTLVLLNRLCPLYLGPLTADEREVYARSFEVLVRLFGRAGVRAVEVSRDLPARCFSDSVHLTPEGGRRLAEEVAPLIRELADQLGYRR